MQRALYHPEQGYYTKHIRSVGGARADFSTTATLSPILARALVHDILAWIHEDRIAQIHLIEIGAGDGSLAKEVFKTLPRKIQCQVSYHIVDASPPLKKVQKDNLKNLQPTSFLTKLSLTRQNPQPFTWHDSIHDALSFCKGQAFLFSNELVDAFPARVFQHNGHKLEELHIDAGEEKWLACEAPPQSSALESMPTKQRREVHESYHQWLKSWADLWHSGRMVTIDYGDHYPALYHRRPMGSLRAYLMHHLQTGSDVYANPGRQDITCDVNFTDLMDWSQALGISTITCKTQQDYLKPFSTSSDTDQFLTSQDGAGSAFRVLSQRR